MSLRKAAFAAPERLWAISEDAEHSARRDGEGRKAGTYLEFSFYCRPTTRDGATESHKCRGRTDGVLLVFYNPQARRNAATSLQKRETWQVLRAKFFV